MFGQLLGTLNLAGEYTMLVTLAHQEKPVECVQGSEELQCWKQCYVSSSQWRKCIQNFDFWT